MYDDKYTQDNFVYCELIKFNIWKQYDDILYLKEISYFRIFVMSKTSMDENCNGFCNFETLLDMKAWTNSKM